jgi:hypothetical protein
MNSLLDMDCDGWGLWSGSEEVVITTIDKYCEEPHIENIDVLKIDTQGFDLHVLRGAQSMLERGRLHMVCTELTFVKQYIGMATPDQIYRFLFHLGYRFVSLYKVSRSPCGLAEYANALFLNPSYFPRIDDQAV